MASRIWRCPGAGGRRAIEGPAPGSGAAADGPIPSGLTMQSAPSTWVGMVALTAAEVAREFAALWPAIYLPLHLRTPPRARRYRPTRESMAVLTHLSSAGPLTVTEAARHMERAQSVMSEIVSRLEGRGLLERMRDERDQRRVLVWLTRKGLETLAREQRVLDEALVCAAMQRMKARERAHLLGGLRALARAAQGLPKGGEHGEPEV
jgi:DNA-binding MarR family transcriptional regulator